MLTLVQRKAGPTPTRKAADAAARARFVANPDRETWWMLTGNFLARQRRVVDLNAGGGKDRARALGLTGPKAPRVTVLPYEPVEGARAIRKAARAERKADRVQAGRVRRAIRQQRRAVRRSA